MTELVAAPPTSPYKGLTPFEDSDRDATLFFGRDREREIIAANLMAYRLTVLYGVSGVGKSSVLRAGVVHHLRRTAEDNRERLGHPQLAIVTFDVWSGDPVAGLLTSVRRGLVDLFGEERVAQSSESLGDSLATWTEELECELYLVLDQIDEYFLYHGEDEEFVLQFADAATRDGLRCNFLLSIREDMLARLDRFKGRIPNLFSNYLRLDHLDREAARAAIVGPIDRYDQLAEPNFQVSIEPALVEAVLDETVPGRVTLVEQEASEERSERPGRVEAPYLQLVMQRLWDEDGASASRTLRLSTLERLGGANEIVRAHLREALEALSRREQDLAETLFNYLVTPSGTKIAHGLGDLAEYAAVPEGAVLPVLSALVEERIVRPVTEGGESDGPRFEIYHDVLAEPVLAWRSRHAAERQLARERGQAQRRHRRLLAVTVVSLLALAAMAFVTVFALQQRHDARAQARNARARALAETASAQLSVDPQRSLRLAAQAVRLLPSPANQEVLRRALILSDERVEVRTAGPVTSVAFNPSGTLAAAASDDGIARLFDPKTGHVLHVLRHRGRVVSVAFSPGGTRVLTASQDGTARIWDAHTGALRETLRHGGPVTSAAFDGNGRLIVTSSGDGTARVWRASDGRLVRVFHHDGPVTQAAISPDGAYAATVAIAGHSQARIWRVRGGQLVRTLPQNGVTKVVFSPNGRLLATAGTDASARLWHTKTGRRALAGPLPHGGDVVDASFSRDGKELVTAGDDGLAYVWKVKTGQRLLLLVGPTGLVTSASFSPDGKYIVAASRDRTARVYNADDGRQVALLAGSGDTVNAAVFDDHLRVLTGGDDDTARVWDPGVRPELGLLARRRVPVAGIAESPDGNVLVAAWTSGAIRVWIRNPRSTISRRSPAGISAVAVSPAGSFFVTTSSNGTARVWDRQGRLLRVLRTGGKLLGAAVDPFGRRVLTWGDDGRAEIWIPRTGHRTLTLRHGAAISSAAFSPDGKLVATAGGDGVVRLWNPSGRLVRRLTGHDGAILKVSFSPSGDRVLAAGKEGSARLWSTSTGAALQTLGGHAGEVRDAEFSHDGQRVVTASTDTDGRIWNVASGAFPRIPRVLRGHFGTVNEASFSPDDRFIVTAGPITAGLWGAASGQLLLYLRGHKPPGPLVSAFFEPDGTRIVTGGRDGSVRRYRCGICSRPAALLQLARTRLADISGG